LIFIFILCDQTSNLKLFFIGIVAESLKYVPKTWLKWGNSWFLFSFFVIECQTSSCFLLVLLLRAWNLCPRLGSNELKCCFYLSFFMIKLQTSSCFLLVLLPRAWNLCPRLGSNELKCCFYFSFFMIKLQTSSCFLLVLLPRAWNLCPRLGSNEGIVDFYFHSLWSNVKPQAIFYCSCFRELEICAQGLAQMR
jgi:hypothetical protein